MWTIMLWAVIIGLIVMAVVGSVLFVLVMLYLVDLARSDHDDDPRGPHYT